MNGKPMEWREGLTFQDIYSFLGYTIRSPKVITRVNNQVIQRNERDGFTLPDEAEVEVVNILCGG
ncbi:MAG: sulfur carrier protein ThiS [Spirochaetales bacterium]|nr:sulfur carrier protein ThiS [Spirochaetales bacterium]